MDTDEFTRISKALADPQRFAMLQQITRQRDELSCKALRQDFDLTAATISHHLKELTNAGLIEGRKEGQCMYLTPRRSTINAYQRELARRMGTGG